MHDTIYVYIYIQYICVHTYIHRYIICCWQVFFESQDIKNVAYMLFNALMFGNTVNACFYAADFLQEMLVNPRMQAALGELVLWFVHVMCTCRAVALWLLWSNVSVFYVGRLLLRLQACVSLLICFVVVVFYACLIVCLFCFQI